MIRTQVRIAKNNSKEFGYQKKYFMIDVVDEITRYYGMAEAIDEADIPNARRRALRNYHKTMDQ